MYTINSKRLIKTFTELVQIPSPSWEEHHVIDYIIDRLKKIHITAKRIKCGKSYNLLISIKGQKNVLPVLFSAHTDTVTPCNNIKPIISETRITSDGTSILGSDDKSAIAMFIEGLHYIKENSMPHGPIEILLTCAEEIGLLGIKNFKFSLVKSKLAFVFDSAGSVGKIIVQAPYHFKMKISIRGKAAHAGMEPEKGINAITVLAKIITALPVGRIDTETTLNAGIISGGRATNIVPDEAECHLEIRSLNNEKAYHYEQEVRKIVSQITQDNRARHKITSSLEYSGYSIHVKEYIAQVAQRSMKRVGMKPSFEVSGGGSDTNIINTHGIKAINLSSGMQKPHSTAEYINIKDLVKGTELMLSIIETLQQDGTVS